MFGGPGRGPGARRDRRGQRPRRAPDYEIAAGRRSVGGNQPIEVRDVIARFSATKAFTATDALQLVERAELDRDTPVARWQTSRSSPASTPTEPTPE
ncbi:serine hydrolase [Streptomyces solisilvae]|uniref:serine hydrolase n=1 Tax=Streptomyces malaysiensis TaxID=92644 RepID=UPI0036B7EE35